MKVSLSDVTVNSPRVLLKLRQYIQNIECYKYFDAEQHFKVYVDRNNDFCAFESVEYNMQFTSADHKLKELISSPVDLDPVSYSDFRLWLNRQTAGSGAY